MLLGAGRCSSGQVNSWRKSLKLPPPRSSPLGAKALTFDLEGPNGSATCPSQVIFFRLCDGLLCWEEGTQELRSWVTSALPWVCRHLFEVQKQNPWSRGYWQVWEFVLLQPFNLPWDVRVNQPSARAC